MPRLDGIETTRALRKAGNDVPILVLTARDAVGDRVEGLDAGADDYLTKPFALEELLARLRALLRRVAPPSGDDTERACCASPTCRMDLATREVRRGDRPIGADPHRVHPARDVPAPAAPGARALVHPRGGLGLRLPDHRQLARGLRRLPAPQDRGRGRAAADPHRARRRLRAAGDDVREPRWPPPGAALPPVPGQPGHPADHDGRRPRGGAGRLRRVRHGADAAAVLARRVAARPGVAGRATPTPSTQLPERDPAVGARAPPTCRSSSLDAADALDHDRDQDPTSSIGSAPASCGRRRGSGAWSAAHGLRSTAQRYRVVAVPASDGGTRWSSRSRWSPSEAARASSAW